MLRIYGSGKTYLAEHDADSDGSAHFEADQFFLTGAGGYEFNPRKLASAHLWCLEQVTGALRDYGDCVVSNTFTTRRELAPYLEVARTLGIEVRIYHVSGDWGSVHNVPAAALRRMEARWETLPGETPVKNYRGDV